MSGWLIGLAVLTAVFVQVPHLIDGLGRESAAWAPVVRMAVGVLLIALGAGLIGFGLVTTLAGSTVIAPILAYLVVGERVDGQLERVRDWMQREHATVTAAILLVIGILLTYTGIRAL